MDDAQGAVQPTVETPSRYRGLRPPWKPGESGNPNGRPSHRRLFEEALARSVTERADEIVKALVANAIEGDSGMMKALLDRLMPRLDRHEIDAGSAPTKLVIEFQKPDAKEAESGNDG